MAALARFAQSDTGRLYAAVCSTWGTDPAPPGMPGVLAFNLRAALSIVHARHVRKDTDQAKAAAGDPLAKARATERMVREHERAAHERGAHERAARNGG